MFLCKKKKIYRLVVLHFPAFPFSSILHAPVELFHSTHKGYTPIFLIYLMEFSIF